MSALNTDALNTAITAGKQAVMVTEYMPGGRGCQVINTANAGTVYVGTSSGVGPSTGVPVPAGSSVQWTEPGEMWAVAGSDVTGTITLVTTALVSNWSPSPEVVGAIIAEQLLANGIPNVMTETLIGDDVVGKGGFSGTTVAGFATLLLFMLDATSAPISLEWFFSDVTLTAIIGFDQWTSELGTPGPVSIPVLGPQFGLRVGASDVNANHTIRMIGTNRPLASPHPIGPGYSGVGFQASTGSQAMVAGTNYQLNTDWGQQFQGPAFAELIVTGSTVKGIFIGRWTTSSATQPTGTMDYGDTAEMHIAGADQKLYRTLAFPGVQFALFFLCTTSGTANVLMRAVPQS